MVQANEIHGEVPHEPGPPQDPAAGGLAGVVCSLGAIGRALQEEFDPQGFLKEFSAHVQRVLPHDRLMIAYLEDRGADVHRLCGIRRGWPSATLKK